MMKSLVKQLFGGDPSPTPCEERTPESALAATTVGEERDFFEPQAPTALAIDVSSSMQPYLAELNGCLRPFAATLQRDPLVSVRARVLVKQFGGSIRTVQPFAPALRLGALEVHSACGSTPLYGATIETLDDCERERQRLQARGVDCYCAQAFVFSDGDSSGESSVVKAEALRRVREAADQRGPRGVNLHVVAVGPKANRHALAELAGKPPICVEEDDVVRLFDWMLKSISRVACSRIGEEIELEPFVGE